jgi:predicted GIY-YIG superfamily endonuclease
MDLLAKIRTIPTEAGVYLYKNAEGEVIYVGKAKNLRSRVSSYFHEGRWEDAKTGTLVREAMDVEYITVANNKEALALENNLIKQRKPRFNILLRDDKTYPYVKLTQGEKWPRVYVTRRLRKDGSVYFGPYFPANLAYRGFDSPQLSYSFLQGGFDETACASLPAVLHSPVPGTLRAGSDYARDVSGSGARREDVSGGTTNRSGKVAAHAHGGGCRRTRV